MGVRLLCVDARKGKGSEHFEHWVEEGVVYKQRRREGSLDPSKQRVLLEEIKNPPVFITELGIKAEPGFALARFVEVDDQMNVIKEHNKTAVPVLN